MRVDLTLRIRYDGLKIFDGLPIDWCHKKQNSHMTLYLLSERSSTVYFIMVGVGNRMHVISRSLS